MATFLLVHGAWHGAWCWDRVTPLLQAAGHRVIAPTLTGLGDLAHLMSPNIGIETHVADVVRPLAADGLRGVVLVGHSYGGFLITAAAHRAPERLSHLVYLDAFVPEDGQSLLELVTPDTRASIESQARAAGGWRSPPIPVARWGVTAVDDVAWLTSRLVDHPLKTFREPITLAGAAPSVLRTYISCTVEQKPHYVATARRVQAQPGWRYRELPTGHDAMITLPRPLADLLLEAAAA